jgi:phosphatidylglycerol:prolipoprotein diacylglycerol transferase
MLTISVDPIAFTIGSLEIRWYGIIVAIAVMALLLIMLREAKKLNITRQVYSVFFWGIIGGFVGARLAYVIYDWEYFVANPLAIIGSLGLAQNGMIIGIIAAALIYMAVTRMRFSTLLSMGDAMAVGAPLAIAIARIGCIVNGCCTGQPSPFEFFPGAVIYTARDSMSPEYWGVAVYPTNFYHLVWNLIVFAIVWRFRGKFKFAGGLVFFYFCLHAVGDFGIRFLRTDEPVLGIFRQAQVMDLGILALFLPWLIIKVRRFKQRALVTEPANEAEPEQSRED